MKRLKHLTFSVLVLVVLLLTCYSLLPRNIYNYGTFFKKTFYAGDDIIWPPPKTSPGIPG